MFCESYSCSGPLIPYILSAMIMYVQAPVHKNKLKFALSVNPFRDTILQIKQKIEAKLGIPSEYQRILCKSAVLSDSELVLDCGIKEGCTIYMEQTGRMVPSFKLIVANINGENVRLVVNSDYTIHEIKNMELYIEEIPINKQCLMYDGCILEDSKTLSEYNIRGESEIMLIQL